MKRNSGQAVSVDERGFVVVDGVKIGRRVIREGAVKIQLCDKDRRRSAERGTRLVEVTVEELGEALQGTGTDLSHEAVREGVPEDTGC